MTNSVSEIKVRYLPEARSNSTLRYIHFNHPPQQLQVGQTYCLSDGCYQLQGKLVEAHADGRCVLDTAPRGR